MTLERIGLPGIGVSHVLLTSRGARLGIVSRLDGCRDIAVYDPDEPDRVAGTVVLRPEEAHVVADVLHAKVTVDHVAGVAREFGGGQAVRIRISAGSLYAGRAVGDIRVRIRTGASIVAVLRGDDVVPSPEQTFVLRADDFVVAVGHEDQVARLRDLLAEAC